MIEGRGEESFKRGSGQAEPGLGYEASGSLSSGRFFLGGPCYMACRILVP